MLGNSTFCQRVLRIYQFMSAQGMQNMQKVTEYECWVILKTLSKNRFGLTSLSLDGMRVSQVLYKLLLFCFRALLLVNRCIIYNNSQHEPHCFWAALRQRNLSPFILAFTFELWGRFCENDWRLIRNWNMTSSRIFLHTLWQPRGFCCLLNCGVWFGQKYITEIIVSCGLGKNHHTSATPTPIFCSDLVIGYNTFPPWCALISLHCGDVLPGF